MAFLLPLLVVLGFLSSVPLRVDARQSSRTRSRLAQLSSFMDSAADATATTTAAAALGTTTTAGESMMADKVVHEEQGGSTFSHPPKRGFPN